jgi:hypothetical protein
MKKQICLLALIGVLLLSAAPAWAQGDFFVIAGGGPPVGTKITYVPYTIPSDQPGFYYLAGNLTYSSTSGSAITVNADNVTLDLMGFTITGTNTPGPIGIYLGNQSNVTIRNGTIYGFDLGIKTGFISGSNRVVNVKFSHTGACSVELFGHNNLLKGCSSINTVANSPYVSTMYIDEGTITGCTVFNSGIGGIGMHGPGNVIGNISYGNAGVTDYAGNFTLGNGGPILVDRNSAFGKNPPNYLIYSGANVTITANNAGTP